MRVAIPCYSPGGLNSQVCPHLGRCEVFTIVELEGGEVSCVELLPNTGTHMGGGMRPAELLAQAGVDAVLCCGMGMRALALLRARGIRVYYTSASTAREAIEELLEGRAKPMEESLACPGEHHRWSHEGARRRQW
ncbi:MAG: dinitrogenase iron-molybdenum cofactor biosynthesis protein [Thermoproteota archaeon]|nr:MAG: dinitrogenase iron-molybdenum cofactor biosynthesis protein [Candidatus Korarchaeota archaeon]RLG55118.1 MAG: dinitrogenase iron-molybdenum cofactor biosynthesis protein [Candidatus Korarchaeota archaeon]